VQAGRLPYIFLQFTQDCYIWSVSNSKPYDLSYDKIRVAKVLSVNSCRDRHQRQCIQGVKAMYIRKAEPADTPVITALQVASLSELCADDYSAPALQALICSKQRDRSWNETIYVAETAEDGIVGFSALSNNSPYINAVFVRPDQVRRGIGSKLLAALEAEAINRQIKMLVVNSSVTAKTFYESQGYRVLTHHAIWLSEAGPRHSQTPVPCVKMQKRLLPMSWKDWMFNIILLAAIAFLIFVLMVP
jgi:GNAT superfamily N-acetyltransferase